MEDCSSAILIAMTAVAREPLPVLIRCFEDFAAPGIRAASTRVRRYR